MEKNRIVYSETQIFWLIITPLSAVLVFMGMAYAYQIGNEASSSFRASCAVRILPCHPDRLL